MCLVSLDFNHSNTKQESLAEQAVWHRQKRFSKKFPEHNPHTQLLTNVAPFQRDINGLFQQYQIYCQESLLQQKGKNNLPNTKTSLAFSAESTRYTSRFSDRTPKQRSQKYRNCCRGNG